MADAAGRSTGRPALTPTWFAALAGAVPFVGVIAKGCTGFLASRMWSASERNTDAGGTHGVGSFTQGGGYVAHG